MKTIKYFLLILTAAAAAVMLTCCQPRREAIELTTPSAPSAPAPTPEKTPEPTPEPTPKPTPEGMLAPFEGFSLQPVPDEIWEKMQGKSYPEGCDLERSTLSYLKLLHIGFDGETHEGEMVVNAEIAMDVVNIFKELYDARYPVEKIRLIDEYDADDETSMTDNNTSSFCYRLVGGTKTLSLHAYGRAIDLNPLYNPYVTKRGVFPEAGKPYVDRKQDNPYYIAKGDICYEIFTKYGFKWGGEFASSKDYQHFSKAG